MKRVTSYTNAQGDVRTRVEIGAVRYGRKTNNRLMTLLLAVAVAVIVVMMIAATAHGQGIVCMSDCQPWQEVGDAPAYTVRVALPIVRK